jgi:acetyl esterase/lipase
MKSQRAQEMMAEAGPKVKPDGQRGEMPVENIIQSKGSEVCDPLEVRSTTGLGPVIGRALRTGYKTIDSSVYDENLQSVTRRKSIYSLHQSQDLFTTQQKPKKPKIGEIYLDGDSSYVFKDKYGKMHNGTLPHHLGITPQNLASKLRNDPDGTFKDAVLSVLAKTGQLQTLSAKKINITTSDDTQVSAVEFKIDPPTTKTIVVFQGQAGNFQTDFQLDRIANMAEKNNANVVAFNYRDSPKSQDELINDALAVSNYVFSRERNGNIELPASEVTFYGESLGGAIAVQAANQLNKQDKCVDLFLMRTPKSLAAAARFMMPENKLLGFAKDRFGAQFIANRLEKNFWDLNTEKTLQGMGTKNRITIVTVEDDKIIPKAADLQVSLTDEQLSNKGQTLRVVCTTELADKHNAPQEALTVLSRMADEVTHSSANSHNQPEEKTTVQTVLKERVHSNPFTSIDEDSQSSETESPR